MADANKFPVEVQVISTINGAGLLTIRLDYASLLYQSEATNAGPFLRDKRSAIRGY